MERRVSSEINTLNISSVFQEEFDKLNIARLSSIDVATHQIKEWREP